MTAFLQMPDTYHISLVMNKPTLAYLNTDLSASTLYLCI